MHGGALGPVADTMLGYALNYGTTDRLVVLTTAHLSIDLLGGIGRDQWLTGQPLPGRLGARMAFGYGQFTVGGEVVAAARAVFCVRDVSADQQPPRPW